MRVSCKKGGNSNCHMRGRGGGNKTSQMAEETKGPRTQAGGWTTRLFSKNGGNRISRRGGGQHDQLGGAGQEQSDRRGAGPVHQVG